MTRRWADDSQADRLLSQLYQHVAEQKGAQFGGGYDIAAGLDRYRAWLREHTEDDAAGAGARSPAPARYRAWLREHTEDELATLDARRALTAMALHPSARRLGTITTTWGSGEAVTAGAAAEEPADVHSSGPGTWGDRHLGPGVAALYRTHSRSLFRMVVLLGASIEAAVELVRDAFVAMDAVWPGLADRDRALAYLYPLVVDRCRKVLRGHRVGTDIEPEHEISMGEYVALGRLERSPLALALRALVPLEREALVLRYGAELPDDQMAAAMRISEDAVKIHAAQAMSALRRILEKREE